MRTILTFLAILLLAQGCSDPTAPGTDAPESANLDVVREVWPYARYDLEHGASEYYGGGPAAPYDAFLALLVDWDEAIRAGNAARVRQLAGYLQSRGARSSGRRFGSERN